MPVRPYTRDQSWLLPPHLEDLLPLEHPARFIAEFVDQLDAERWRELGVEPEVMGAPAYDPRLLLSVWCYGFMTGVRSSRKLEAACKESIPYLWLTGMQTPDHNTLWRFYQEHREHMQALLKWTVRTAVASGLLELAIQAVDGSKVKGNASTYRLYTKKGLSRLLERAEQAIADLEAQNQTGGEPVPPKLPAKLREKTALRATVLKALAQIGDEERLNLTDEDAKLLKVRGGYLLGYNAQAVASPVAAEAGGGQLITAASVGGSSDSAELLPMLEAAEANLGRQPEQSLADAGYHSAENIARSEEEGRRVLMPDRQKRNLGAPYHKDAFSHDATSDTYWCPKGEILKYQGINHNHKGQPVRRYRAVASTCRACPAFGVCTTNARHGRTLEIGPHDDALRRHRLLMETPDAQSAYSLRKQIIEPVFGILKEQMDGRRFLLRGRSNVGAEWSLLAAAYNLRVLARVWRTALA